MDYDTSVKYSPAESILRQICVIINQNTKFVIDLVSFQQDILQIYQFSKTNMSVIYPSTVDDEMTNIITEIPNRSLAETLTKLRQLLQSIQLDV
jgi:hypothetical protein